MANSWSFLYDELKMDEKRDSSQDYWYEDGFSLTGNPSAAQDTISFGSSSADTIYLGSHVPGGMGDDHISFNLPMIVTGKPSSYQ